MVVPPLAHLALGLLTRVYIGRPNTPATGDCFDSGRCEGVAGAVERGQGPEQILPGESASLQDSRCFKQNKS